MVMVAGLAGCGSRTGGNADADGTGTSAEAKEISYSVAKADADSLLGFVTVQVECGPRNPGSPGHQACRQLILDLLERYGVDSVTVQEAPVTTFRGERLTAYNILGRINPMAENRVLLLAHYDTRPWADEDPREENHGKPLDGANDGASGTAVLLDVARALSQTPPDSLGIDLLFVDLEDSGQSGAGDEESWCLGTQKWVENMPYDHRNRPMYGILLDMVGGRDAVFHREYISQACAKSIVDKVWAVANASGYADRFPNAVGGSVIDDHLYVNRAGIPCIDIIENANPHTGTFNPTWHTMADNLGAIDAKTLEMVSQVVLNTLFREDELLKQ